MSEESVEQFEERIKQIKQDQEEYFKLITSGYCAICLVELNIDKNALKALDTTTCEGCHKKGWDKIFQLGILCGRELKEWKNKQE